MKKIFSLRTKAEVLASILLISIILGTTGVYGVTRIITDSSDQIYTYIRDSEGNFYEVDGTADDVQIQAALDAVEGTNGSVDLIPNTDYYLSQCVDMPFNVTLDGNGATIRPTGDFECFEVELGCTLEDMVIDVSDASYSNDTFAINLTVSRNVFGNPKWMQEGFDHERRRTIQDVSIIGYGQVGGGIKLETHTATTRSISNVYCRNIYVMQLNKGIYLHVTSAGGYINVNEFSGIRGNNVSRFIHLHEESATEELAQNTFIGVFHEAEGDNVYDQLAPIFLEGDEVKQNVFLGITSMDWQGSGDEDAFIRIEDSGASYNMFQGQLSNPVTDYIVDNGTSTMFLSNRFSKLDTLVFTPITGTAAGGNTEGALYYNSDYNTLRLRTNTGWVNVSTAP